MLGTDELGRDILSRILFGSSYSLSIGLAAIFLTLVLGVLMGSLSGYFEGWTDRIVMRISDLFLSIPGLFLILGMRAIFPDLSGRLGLYVLIVATFTLLGWGLRCPGGSRPGSVPQTTGARSLRCLLRGFPCPDPAPAHPPFHPEFSAGSGVGSSACIHHRRGHTHPPRTGSAGTGRQLGEPVT